MKIKNIYLALLDQLPLSRLWRNWRNGNLKGLFHIRSHLTNNSKPKISYPSKASAIRAAESMEKKTGSKFGKWKCVHCDGFHIGKNRVKTTLDVK